MTLRPDDFARLYRTHAQTLLLHFQRRVHDPEVARDLLAETFERAIAAGPGYRGRSERALHGWLWTIARNVLADQGRRDDGDRGREDRLRSLHTPLTTGEIERVEELAGLAALRASVERGMAALPDDQREAVRLRVVEDRPYEEIAAVMDTTVEATRARVSRGLRALGVAIEDEHQAWKDQ
jgi:RNA polymerase sigma factor (sigma-70 family)